MFAEIVLLQLSNTYNLKLSGSLLGGIGGATAVDGSAEVAPVNPYYRFNLIQYGRNYRVEEK